MRTVTLSGQDFIVNPLKGKDIKALKAQGFDLMGGGYSISEGMDAVFVGGTPAILHGAFTGAANGQVL